MPWNSLLRRFFRSRRKSEINPDEIFLDAHNLPRFDESQFEGRMERSLSKKTFLYFGTIVMVVVLIFTGRIFQLQIIEGKAYVQESENNRLEHSLIFSDRGLIYDREGTLLAQNGIYEGEPFSKRIYTEHVGVAHLIGYGGYPLRDINEKYYQETFVGKSGIESVFNTALTGSNGLKIVETNALGEIQSESIIRPPESGHDIVLSIDARVSHELYRLIKERAEQSGFTGGAGIIMDIKTGEILALSSYPEFDPNALTEGGTESVQGYISDERKPFLNRVTTGLYAPGSIIKPFIATAALEENIIDPEKEILSTGILVLPNPFFPEQPSVFHDWRAHGWVDMRHALAVSSDIYFYQIGGGFENQPGLGIQKIDTYARLFGFGETTGSVFSSEAVGTIPTPEWKEKVFDDIWRIGDTYNTAIGQYGFQVTTLQVVRALAAIANNGTLLTPTPILGGGSSERKIRLSFKSENLQVVREGMRLAVMEGTAAGLSVPWLAIAAKTGTAELGVQKDFVNSWVTGFFPYENPRYAFVVLMEHGPAENTIGGLYVMRWLFEWMRINTPEYLSLQ